MKYGQNGQRPEYLVLSSEWWAKVYQAQHNDPDKIILDPPMTEEQLAEDRRSEALEWL